MPAKRKPANLSSASFGRDSSPPALAARAAPLGDGWPMGGAARFRRRRPEAGNLTKKPEAATASVAGSLVGDATELVARLLHK
jgi:hypothetical protein